MFGCGIKSENTKHQTKREDFQCGADRKWPHHDVTFFMIFISGLFCLWWFEFFWAFVSSVCPPHPPVLTDPDLNSDLDPIQLGWLRYFLPIMLLALTEQYFLRVSRVLKQVRVSETCGPHNPSVSHNALYSTQLLIGAIRWWWSVGKVCKMLWNMKFTAYGGAPECTTSSALCVI